MFKYCFLISLLFFTASQAANEKKAEEKTAEEEPLATSPETNPELGREKQISTIIERELHGGEAVWLGNGDNTFLALYKENTWKETHGAILILHDMGANADWPNLIKPLRLTFPQKGWHSLSLQLPMVTTDNAEKNYLSLLDESVLRINAGIEFLKQKNVPKITIIGHGVGATVGIFYLNQNPQAAIAALVAISLSEGTALKQPQQTSETKNEDKVDSKTPTAPPATQSKSEKNNAEQSPIAKDLFTEMEKIKVPFLDVYAQQDHQDVVKNAEKRVEIMQSSENSTFIQWQIEGADHYFRGTEVRLIKRLRGWLKKNI